MKKVGIVGGLGPASTVDYYLGLIERNCREHGEDQYPQIVIDSVNMGALTGALLEERYEDVADQIVKSVGNLKVAGAEVAAIASNTPHIVWKFMDDRFEIPVISIVEESVKEMIRCGYRRVLVFGTYFTLKSGLYETAIRKAGLTPIVPGEEDIEVLGNLIYPNLENGIIIPEDREAMIALAEKYIEMGQADSILLGCTEIPLVIKPGDVSVPVLDTTQIHIDAIYRQL